MRSLLVIVGLCTLVHAQTFKSTVDQVAVPVTIQSHRNEPVGDLRRDDFRVFDDGRPVPIVSFGRVRQAVHVLLLLDISRSMATSLSEARAAAAAVAAQLAPDDSIRVGTFSGVLRLSPPFSSDDRDLIARLPLRRSDNVTILYDALVEGCGAFTAQMDRRAIFVVSDGMDTASSASVRLVMQRAAESNVAIYAIGLSSRTTERGNTILRAPDSTLRAIAEDTGGRYINAGAGTDTAGVLKGMIEELHQQYLLGFTPAAADGRIHSLVVTTRQAGMTVRARKQYLAPPRKAAAP